MSSQEALLIDFSQEDAALEALPRSPVLSSNGLGWSGLRLEYHRQPAHETPELVSVQHVVSLVTTERPYLNERKENQQFKARYDHKGDIYIYPAKQPIHHRWHTEVESIHIYLEPQLFSQLGEDCLQSTTVELLPQFGIRDSLIQEIGLTLKSELQKGNNSRLYVESAATFLIAHLIRRYCHIQTEFRNYRRGLPKHKLQRAVAYIQTHLSEDISLEAIASELDMSPYYFCRLFKKSMGISPYQYVIKCRIDWAKKLLSSESRPIADIALQVGFTSHSQFAKHFKRIVGVTPKQART